MLPLHEKKPTDSGSTDRPKHRATGTFLTTTPPVEDSVSDSEPRSRMRLVKFHKENGKRRADNYGAGKFYLSGNFSSNYHQSVTDAR